MKAQYILYGFAALFLAIAVRQFFKTGTLLSSHRTYLLVAAIFIVVAAVLQFAL